MGEGRGETWLGPIVRELRGGVLHGRRRRRLQRLLRGISDGAFAGCSSLALAALLAGLNRVGAAFDSCSSLALAARRSHSLLVVRARCSSFALAALPTGFTSVGLGAFVGCSSLALDGLRSIDHYAFSA